MEKRIVDGVEVQFGSDNVYADLGYANADEMLLKAQLANKIGEIIKARRWSQQQAADAIGMTQPKLSQMLRGQFRGISQAKMLDCLTRLGRDVQIVVGPARRKTSPGRVAVVFA
jgi:predicted XRE-type DNA-binding protein